MSASITWSDLVTKIKGVANKGNLNWSGSNTTYTIPAGYYSGGTLDSRTSYNNGYSAGRTQGQNDVKNSPNSYSLYTKSQYDANYTNGYNKAKSNITIKSGTGNSTGSISIAFSNANTMTKMSYFDINPGGTPIMAFLSSQSRNDTITVRAGSYFCCNTPHKYVSTSFSWTSSSVRLPVNQVSGQAIKYFIAVAT